MSQPKVVVLIYSLYGHIATMAREVVAGLEAAGCEALLCRAPELLPEEVLTKMHAPPADESIPLVDVKKLPEADGIIFGIPTRFGMAAAQMKSVWDSTGSLWQTGALIGKPAGIFVSTATQGGGQETTALTWVSQLAHHGMVFVPMGYSTPLMFNMDEMHGGSAYGAGCFAGGDGSRQPSELEKGIAKHQGTHFGGIVKALKAGKSA